MVMVVLSVLCMASSAAAQVPGLEHLPKKCDVLMGVNVANSRGTVLFKELLKTMKDSPEGKAFYEGLKREVGLDLAKDIDYLVMAFPNAASGQTNPNRMPFSVLARGKIDNTKVQKLLEKGVQEKRITLKKIGKRSSYELQDGLQFALVGKDSVLLTSGSKKFRASTIRNAGKTSASVKKNKVITGLLKQVNTSRSIWMVADTSKLGPATKKKKTKKTTTTKDPDPAGASPANALQDGSMDHLLMSVDLSSGMALNASAKMDSAETATAASTELKAQIEKAKGNPFVNIFQATPLFDRAAINTKKTEVTLTSSMTSKEFETFLTTLFRMAAQPKAVPSQPKATPRPKGAPTP